MVNVDTINDILENNSYQFAYLLVMFVLILIVAWKEGLKTWVLSKLRRNTEAEGLTSGRGEPDFWVIGSELDSTRREHMSHGLSPSQERELRRLTMEHMLNSSQTNRLRKLTLEHMNNAEKRRLVSIL